jgi:hypothetical protein
MSTVGGQATQPKLLSKGFPMLLLNTMPNKSNSHSRLAN